MRTLHYLIVLVVSIALINACTPPSPNPSEVFIKFYGGTQDQEGVDVQQLEDDGFIILSDSRSFSPIGSITNKHLYLIKTDAAGNEEWAKVYGNPERSTQGRKIVVLDDGFIILANEYKTPIESKILLLRLDRAGELIWSKVWREDSIGVEIAQDIEKTDNNTFLITGNSTAINPNKQDVPNADDITDIFYAEIDDNGELLASWLTDEIQGFVGSEYGAGIRLGTNYIYILATSDLSSETGFLLLRIQPNGNWKDDRRYQPSLTNISPYANMMQQTASGDLVFMGFIETADGVHLCVQKVNSDLTPSWDWLSTSDKYLSNDVSLPDIFNNGNIQIVPSGGYIVSGTIRPPGEDRQYSLTRLNENGTEVWTKNFGNQGHDYISRVIPTNDDGFAVIGTSNLEGHSLVTLVKLNENGELIPTIE